MGRLHRVRCSRLQTAYLTTAKSHRNGSYHLLCRSQALPACEEHDHRTWRGVVAIARNRRGRLPIHDVLWTRERRVDPPSPGSFGRHWRQLKFQRLPVAIHDEVHHQLLFPQLRAEGDAALVRSPIGLVEFHAMPGLVRLLDEFGQARSLLLMRHVTKQSSGKK